MSELSTILITGGGGQLASDLEQQLAVRGEPAARSHAELDVADGDSMRQAFEELRPGLLINCAAFHNVDVCEREEATALAVNCTAVKRMAELCAEYDTRLVHLSTNYVFDGRRADPYSEHDLPSPTSVYALSKLAGEHAALAYAPDALVVRAAGLFGLHGSVSKGGNFVVRMLNRAREQGELKMVADQLLSPTFTADLAAAIIEAVDAQASGVVHLAAAQSCSWHEFTEAIMELAGLDVPVAEVQTTRAPGGADRPLNGVLARPGADALGLTPLPSWRDGLERYMALADLLAPSSAQR
ncbi:MAG TPA: dTDP-4-dehydrorhamnose reductase [Thermoleophilaceae bacterium]